MPDWKTHIVFGLLVAIAWVAVFPFLGMQPNIEKVSSLIFVAAAASLFPDIDVRNSKMRGMIALLLAASVAIAYVIFFTSTWYYVIAYFGLIYFLVRYLPTKHRGVTHKPQFALLFSAAVVLVYIGFKHTFAFVDVVTWFFIALSSYAVHLAIDSL